MRMPVRPFLIVRADAGRAMGYGHLVRSAALASAWRAAGGDAVLVTSCERLPGDLEGEMIEIIPPSHDTSGDFAVLARIASARPPDWLAIDGCHFDLAYVATARGFSRRVLLVADEPNDATIAADGVLDHNLGSEHLPYRTAPGTLCLFGPRYALLRAAFAATAGVRHTRTLADRVLLIMGASDVAGRIPELMRAIDTEIEHRIQVAVVVGAGGANVPSIEAVAASARRSRFQVYRDPADLRELMASADVAVSAAGTTVWELCALGVPTVLVTVAANQVRGAAALDRAGAAINLGPVAALTARDLGVRLRSILEDAPLRARLATAASALVDGRGAGRVVEALRERLA